MNQTRISDLDFVRGFARRMMERTTNEANQYMTGSIWSCNEMATKQLMSWNRGYAQACQDILSISEGK